MTTDHVIDRQDTGTASIATIAKPLDHALADLIQAYLHDPKKTAEGNLYRVLKSQIEKGTFLAALRLARGNKTKAAKILGINRKILSEKIIRYFDSSVVGKPYQSRQVLTDSNFDTLRQTVYDNAYTALKTKAVKPAGVYRWIISNIEDAMMQNLLQRTKGNQTQAAKIMGIGRSVFCQKIKKNLNNAT